MFRNYVITALRNLAHNRLYAGINVIGLAVGFAAIIFAVLFVRDQLTYDQWIPGYRQIYAQIIGVVPDFALDSIHNSISPAYYYLHPEDTIAGEGVNIKVRTAAGEKATLDQLDKAFKEHFDGIPEHRYSLERHLKDTVADIVRRSEIFTALTTFAVFVASLGLFGLSLFTAGTRTKEIGIRKAMGATRGEIVGLLLRRVARPVLLANVISWPAAYVIMQGWLEGFAGHVDLAPWMFVGTSVLMLVIALLTVIGQAQRVARTQPVAALRYE